MPPRGFKTITLPEKIHKTLERYSKKLKISKSKLAAELIAEGLKRYREQFTKKPLKKRKRGEEAEIFVAGV